MSDTDAAKALFFQALDLIDAGDMRSAEVQLHAALRLLPANVSIMTNLAVVLLRLGKASEARPHAETAARLKPDNVEALIVLARCELDEKHFPEALSAYDRIVELEPRIAAVHNDRGLVLAKLGRFQEAIQSYDRAVEQRPDFAEAYNNRGSALHKLEQFESALANFEKALSLKNDFAEAWLGCGHLFARQKRYEEAQAAFDRALSVNPDLTGAWLGRANVLVDLGLLDEALAGFDRALALNPDLAEAWLGRGNAYSQREDYDKALNAYDRASALDPEMAEAWLGHGNIFSNLERFPEAFAAFDKVFCLKPSLDLVEGSRIHAKMDYCDWSNLKAECHKAIASVREGKNNMPPLALLSIDASADVQLQCARTMTADRFSRVRPVSAPASNSAVPPGRKIRIGYYSADFITHPVTTLAAGLFEHHDRSMFDIIAFSFRSPADDVMHRRIRTAFQQFKDCRGMSDRDVHELSVRAELDIAVDLMGHTADNRTGLFAMRVAPIQINYLGYPGSMGAPFIDYIIADHFVIPAGQEKFYAEKIARLPDCFQINDDRRSPSPAAPARSSLNLPDDGFVFCCFNNLYKINPDMFDVWMRLLHATEGSVLWLTASGPAAENLRREASARSIDPQRIVCSPRADYQSYLARYGAADLFLDTLPFNAGTTASDALWAGLPLVTCTGEAFASRMAGSLLRSVGLSDLITSSLPDYEALAVALARDPERLASIKAKLASGRHSTPLFDTARTTRQIEEAYKLMHARHRAGLPADAISVPAS
jgi:protein O-GlcNAc transferase